MSRPLDLLSVEGFKSIRRLNLQLNALNVFVGANGAGKSNLVLLFRMLHEMMAERLQPFFAANGGIPALFFRGPAVTERISLDLTFGANGYHAELAPAESGGVYFEIERQWFQGPDYTHPYSEHLGSGHTEARLKSRRGSGIASYTYPTISQWMVYHFHDTSRTARVKQQHSIGDNLALAGSAGNLAAFLRAIRHSSPTRYQQVVRLVRQVAPFFDDFVLEPEAADPSQIMLRWRDRGADSVYTAHQLSDGTLRFICLATALLQPNPPSAVVIDEPELGLHPFAVVVLAGLLQAAATETQVIVCTQSVTLLNQFDPGSLIVVDRDGGESLFRRPHDKELSHWLDGYSLGELWEKNLIGGRPK